jgi:hypothetical protein
MAVIVVTGLPRSGTSMMMAMLEAGGVPPFCEQRADEFNPDGYYEHPLGLAGDFAAIPDGHAAKCLHMLPTRPAEDGLRAVVMRRNPAAMFVSASKVHRARGLAAPDGDFMVAQLDAIRLWCASVPHIEVWYEDVLRNTARECLRVQRFLGLSEQRLAAMAEVVRDA